MSRILVKTRESAMQGWRRIPAGCQAWIPGRDNWYQGTRETPGLPHNRDNQQATVHQIHRSRTVYGNTSKMLQQGLGKRAAVTTRGELNTKMVEK